MQVHPLVMFAQSEVTALSHLCTLNFAPWGRMDPPLAFPPPPAQEVAAPPLGSFAPLAPPLPLLHWLAQWGRTVQVGALLMCPAHQ